jgi:hypothetical protein
MSQNEYGAELTQDDPVPERAPAGETNPGDYMSGEAEGVSEDTGTVYDREGEPEATPHDAALDSDDPTDPAGPNAGTSATAEDE